MTSQKLISYLAIKSHVYIPYDLSNKLGAIR